MICDLAWGGGWQRKAGKWSDLGVLDILCSVICGCCQGVDGSGMGEKGEGGARVLV